MLPLVLKAGRHEDEITGIESVEMFDISPPSSECAASPKREDGLSVVAMIGVPIAARPPVSIRLKRCRREPDTDLVLEVIQQRTDPQLLKPTGSPIVTRRVREALSDLVQ